MKAAFGKCDPDGCIDNFLFIYLFIRTLMLFAVLVLELAIHVLRNSSSEPS